jgi:hypothetical protein
MASSSTASGGGNGNGGTGLLHRATMLVVCLTAVFMTSSSTAMTPSSGCAVNMGDDVGIRNDVKLEDIPVDGLADVVIRLPITKSIGKYAERGINLCGWHTVILKCYCYRLKFILIVVYQVGLTLENKRFT